MGTTGNVVITISDAGGSTAANVPAPSLVAVQGCCSAGTANVPYSTRSIATLIANSGYGPAVSLAAILIAQGATVIFNKLTQTSAGTATSVTAGSGNTGATVMTVTLDGTVGAFDTYNVKVSCPTGGNGTVGTAAKIQISMDGGRTAGPIINLATATTYAIPNTGVTLNFTAATIAVGDTYVFSTVEPKASAANVATGLTALQNSIFAQAGWGNMISTGPRTGSDTTTIETTMDALAAGYLFDRMMLNARDGAAPVAWGGAGETESAWTTAIQADFSGIVARRLLVSAGHYNMPEAIASAAYGTPRLRRPASWAIMARRVGLAVQVLGSQVNLGPLPTIVVDPTNDPSDGWVYHDERANPGLDATRFATLWTRLRQGQGFFERSENLMSPLGSDFPLYAVGQCFDNFCDTLTRYFTANIDIGVRTNRNGTIYENDAKTLESGAMSLVEATMTGQFQPANTSITIDRTYNVKTNSKALVNAVFGGVAYIREFDVTLSMQNPLAA